MGLSGYTQKIYEITQNTLRALTRMSSELGLLICWLNDHKNMKGDYKIDTWSPGPPF